jgi:iron complex outermembrane receptor protein
VGGELRAAGQWNGRGGGASGELHGGLGGLRGIGWRVQGSGRRVGDASAPEYVLSNTGLREWNGSLAAGFRDHRRELSLYASRFQRELGILRAAHIGSTTDLAAAIASATPWYVAPFTYAIDAPRQTVLHHLVKAHAALAVSDSSRVELTYGFQADSRQEYDVRRAGRSATPSVDLWLTTHTGEAGLKHWVGNRLHGRAGLSGLAQQNVNLPGTGVRPLLPDYRKEALGAFVVEHLPLGRRWEVEAGARIEGSGLRVYRFTASGEAEQRAHRFLNTAAAVGAEWSATDSVHVRFGLATAFRPPQVSELYSEGLHHGSAAIEEGDPALGSERAVKATADLVGSWFGGRLRADATLHASRIDGYIYLRPDGTRLTVRGAFPVFRYTATDALIHGADASVQWSLTKRTALRLRAGAVRGNDLLRSTWLYLMPGDRAEQSLILRWPRAGSWKGIEASFTSRYVLRQGRFEEGLDFAPPPAAYHLWGMEASGTRPWGRGELRVALQAANLINSAYREYLDRFRYYAEARGLDVTLSIRYAFGSGAE